MSLSARKTIFGVHSVTPYSRTDGTPYGIALVVQSGTFKLEGDTIELRGGSNRFAWDIEDGDINAELGFSVSEYPSWLFTLFGGKAPTEGTPETGGDVSDAVNKKGTSIVAATGILAAIAVDVAAKLKTGKYVLKATDANTLSVYCMSNIDFGRNNDSNDFLDDTLKIGSIDVATTVEVDLTAFGLTFTGGGSVTAFVTGDTAEFEVRAINTKNREVVIGGISDTFPDFGAIIYAQKKGTGAIFEIDAYKLKNIGLGLGAERKAWANNEYTAKASYDSEKNGVCRIREVE